MDIVIQQLILLMTPYLFNHIYTLLTFLWTRFSDSLTMLMLTIVSAIGYSTFLYSSLKYQYSLWSNLWCLVFLILFTLSEWPYPISWSNYQIQTNIFQISASILDLYHCFFGQSPPGCPMRSSFLHVQNLIHHFSH